jgi:hypothetical protein
LLVESALYLAAIVAGAAPRRLWRRLEPPLPLVAAAVPAGILTVVLGFVIGVPAFFRYAEHAADVNNAWMLRTITLSPSTDPYALTTRTTALSMLALFAFLFLTPLGLLTTYLIASGTVRAVSAGIADDPRGDFSLSAADWGATTLIAGIRSRRRRRARERRKGADAPDVLATGEWGGLKADYVVIAARPKPEWEPGAIILTSSDWYRLGDAARDGNARRASDADRRPNKKPRTVHDRRGFQFRISDFGFRILTSFSALFLRPLLGAALGCGPLIGLLFERAIIVVLPAAQPLGGRAQTPADRLCFRLRLGLRLAFGFRARIELAADELDLCDFGGVAAAEADAQQARVAARALGEPRRNHVEQLRHDLAVLQILHDQTPRVQDLHFRRRGRALAGMAVGEAALGDRDQALDKRPQLLRLGHRRRQVLVAEQRRRLIAQHRDAMLGDAPQFSMCDSVSHGRYSCVVAAG